jgi:subtilisin family serine protease
VLAAVDTVPNDFDWPEQWGLRRTEFPQAWGAAQNGSRTVVAVLDTGVERTHPELAGLVLRGTDFVNDDAEAADDNGHGTAVAGIIAARANNGIGIAGACWPCAILPVKVLGRNGSGITSDVAAGIIWAVEHGARVINMSLGGFGTTIALRDALAYAAGRDVVLVGAAGNDGLSDRFYPAADQHVVAVAASNPADQLYVWSNRGPWVDVAAPGCTPTLWRGAGYAGFCGTSAASPIVTALAGLIRSTRPAASRAEVARAITESAHAIASVECGRIDAAGALSVSRSAPAGRGRRAGPASGKRRLQAFARTHGSSPPRHAGPAAASAPDSKPAAPLPSPPAVSGPRVAFSPSTERT